MVLFLSLVFVFFFKQKTAYEMRISDWSSDVCSSDLTDSCSLYTQSSLTADVASNFFQGQQGDTSGQGPPATLPSSDVYNTWTPTLQQFKQADRKSGVKGKRVSGRVNLGGGRNIKKKKKKEQEKQDKINKHNIK